MHGYTDAKDDYLKRLRRVEGQVRGIARMVDEDVYCIDILTQVAQDPLEERDRELLPDRQVVRPHRVAVRGRRQLGARPHRIVRLRRDPHAAIVPLARRRNTP